MFPDIQHLQDQLHVLMRKYFTDRQKSIQTLQEGGEPHLHIPHLTMNKMRNILIAFSLPAHSFIDDENDFEVSPDGWITRHAAQEAYRVLIRKLPGPIVGENTGDENSGSTLEYYFYDGLPPTGSIIRQVRNNELPPANEHVELLLRVHIPTPCDKHYVDSPEYWADASMDIYGAPRYPYALSVLVWSALCLDKTNDDVTLPFDLQAFRDSVLDTARKYVTICARMPVIGAYAKASLRSIFAEIAALFGEHYIRGYDSAMTWFCEILPLRHQPRKSDTSGMEIYKDGTKRWLSIDNHYGAHSSDIAFTDTLMCSPEKAVELELNDIFDNEDPVTVDIGALHIKTAIPTYRFDHPMPFLTGAVRFVLELRDDIYDEIGEHGSLRKIRLELLRTAVFGESEFEMLNV